MLLEVSIENFNSFSEKQTFTMYANGTGNILNSTFSAGYYRQNKKIKKIKLYNTSVIYGLNNSGKSNFIVAVSLIRGIVEYSIKMGLPKSPHYFLLDPKYKDRPSIFEIVFIAKDNIKYKYSFAFDNIRIYNEKLIGYPKGQEKLYFERKFNKETNSYTYDTKNLIGNSNTQIDGMKGDTRSDCLFLSMAKERGNNHLKYVVEFLTNGLNVMTDFMLYRSNQEAITILEDDDKKANEFKNIFKKLMNDNLIQDIIVKDGELGTGERLRMEKELEESPLEKQKSIKDKYRQRRKRIKILRKDSCGNLVEFDLNKMESEGTNNIINLISMFFKIKNNGEVLFFDELDASLHPKMLILLMKLIYKMNWNVQLIFTAHNTVLLKKMFNVFKKYQVWFVDKDYNGNSVLYSAGETSVRNEKDLEELYFNGRFSDIPEDEIIDELKGV